MKNTGINVRWNTKLSSKLAAVTCALSIIVPFTGCTMVKNDMATENNNSLAYSTEMESISSSVDTTPKVDRIEQSAMLPEHKINMEIANYEQELQKVIDTAPFNFEDMDEYLKTQEKISNLELNPTEEAAYYAGKEKGLNDQDCYAKSYYQTIMGLRPNENILDDLEVKKNIVLETIAYQPEGPILEENINKIKLMYATGDRDGKTMLVMMAERNANEFIDNTWKKGYNVGYSRNAEFYEDYCNGKSANLSDNSLLIASIEQEFPSTYEIKIDGIEGKKVYNETQTNAVVKKLKDIYSYGYSEGVQDADKTAQLQFTVHEKGERGTVRR